MRWFARALLLLVFALPFAGLATLWLALEQAPTVEWRPEAPPQASADAKRPIERKAPHGAGPTTRPRTVTLSGRELEMLVDQVASRIGLARDGSAAARVTLQPGKMRLQASAQALAGPLGRYLNVDAVLLESERLPRFERLQIGALRIPAPLADRLLRTGLAWLASTEGGALADEIVQAVHIMPSGVRLTYDWNGDLAARAGAVLLPPVEQARLRAYHERLVDALSQMPPRVSLADLMPALFETVVARAGEQPVDAESRAAITVLAFHATGRSLAAVVPAAARWPAPAARTVTLAGRADLAKHFLVSAAIAASAGSPLADAAGLHKEIEDARAGSGFSFADLAADRAGVRLGELVSGSAHRATQLARTLAGGVRERDFMPEIADLPESLSQAEFERRFGGIGAPAYREMSARIDARVASRPLFRE